MGHLSRIAELALGLPEAMRVDIDAWDGQPTFRVRGKNFVFTNAEGTFITVKLSREEAAAVVAADPAVSPTGYGLGRHGWISVELPDIVEGDRWEEIVEWILTSYTLVAPKALAASIVVDGWTD